MNVGQIVTVKAEKNESSSFKKGKNAIEKANRPAWLDSVKSCFSLSGNIADSESYSKLLAKRGEETKGGAVWWQWVKAGVVQHKTNGAQYVALLNPRNGKKQYFIGNERPTVAQLKVIKQWRLKKSKPQDFAVVAVNNITNLDKLGII